METAKRKAGKQPRKRKIEETFEKDEIQLQDEESSDLDLDCIVMAACK